MFYIEFLANLSHLEAIVNEVVKLGSLPVIHHFSHPVL